MKKKEKDTKSISKKETINTFQNNRLIASYMGWSEVKGKTENLSDLYYTEEKTGNTLCTSDMAFHKSWDWILPVIKKVKSEINTWGEINESTSDLLNTIDLAIDDLSIENAWISVLALINLINKSHDDFEEMANKILKAAEPYIMNKNGHLILELIDRINETNTDCSDNHY